MTRDRALKETVALWTRLADYAEKCIIKQKWEIIGPWQDYIYFCPCCEYAKRKNIFTFFLFSRCKFCPMKKQWRNYDKKHIYCNLFCCMPSNSPYNQWCLLLAENTKKALFYDLEFFCRLIAELAEEARGKLK